MCVCVCVCVFMFLNGCVCVRHNNVLVNVMAIFHPDEQDSKASFSGALLPLVEVLLKTAAITFTPKNHPHC